MATTKRDIDIENLIKEIWDSSNDAVLLYNPQHVYKTRKYLYKSFYMLCEALNKNGDYTLPLEESNVLIKLLGQERVYGAVTQLWCLERKVLYFLGDNVTACADLAIHTSCIQESHRLVEAYGCRKPYARYFRSVDLG